MSSDVRFPLPPTPSYEVSPRRARRMPGVRSPRTAALALGLAVASGCGGPRVPIASTGPAQSLLELGAPPLAVMSWGSVDVQFARTNEGPRVLAWERDRWSSYIDDPTLAVPPRWGLYALDQNTGALELLTSGDLRMPGTSSITLPGYSSAITATTSDVASVHASGDTIWTVVANRYTSTFSIDMGYDPYSYGYGYNTYSDTVTTYDEIALQARAAADGAPLRDPTKLVGQNVGAFRFCPAQGREALLLEDSATRRLSVVRLAEPDAVIALGGSFGDSQYLAAFGVDGDGYLVLATGSNNVGSTAIFGREFDARGTQIRSSLVWDPTEYFSTYHVAVGESPGGTCVRATLDGHWASWERGDSPTGWTRTDGVCDVPGEYLPTESDYSRRSNPLIASGPVIGSDGSVRQVSWALRTRGYEWSAFAVCDTDLSRCWGRRTDVDGALSFAIDVYLPSGL